MDDHPLLVAPRLTLRGFQLGDLDALAAIYADPEVARYLRSGARTRQRTAAALDEYIAAWRDQGYGVWAVASRERGALLGMCGFVGKAEMGYILGRAAWDAASRPRPPARACVMSLSAWDGT